MAENQDTTAFYNWLEFMRLSKLPANAKLVCYGLSTYMDRRSGICWPSHMTLMADTSLSRTTIKKQLSMLEGEGWIVVTRCDKSTQLKKGSQATNRYALNVPVELRIEHAKKTLNDAIEGGSPDDLPAKGGSADDHEGGRQTTTNLPLEPSSKESKPSDIQKFTDQDMKTAKWIYGKLLQMNPGHKKPNGQSWAEAVRKIRELDGKTDTEIRTLFIYANEDHFWKTNILSPSKLREKWDMLTIRMNEKKKGPEGEPSIYAKA